jgi:hypothetical protein
MIDYDKPDEDPIVAEVRKAREEIAARYNYDLHALFADMMRRQAQDPDRYVKSRVSQASEASESHRPKKAG